MARATAHPDHDRLVSFKSVHASRGKVVRAEPIAALYEQRKVHHVGNSFTSDFDRGRNGYSPDRVPAARGDLQHVR